MEFLFLVLVVAFVWYGLSAARRSSLPHGGQKHCMTCGMDSEPKSVTKGSIWIEIILWLCFLIPGLIYSIWRLNNKGTACPACGATTLVPFESPAAVAHRKQLQA